MSYDGFHSGLNFSEKAAYQMGGQGGERRGRGDRERETESSIETGPRLLRLGGFATWDSHTGGKLIRGCAQKLPSL